jgi:hypothetical protein
MGYLPGNAPEPVTELIQELSEELMPMSSIKAEYRVFNNVRLLSEDKTVEIRGVMFNVQPVIFRQIKESEDMALFICTAGPYIGEMSRRCMKDGDLLRGYVYDVIGSEVVENAADRLQQEIKRAAAEEGKNISNRFSPGYCGWDVAEQHKLFSFFKDNFCAITLNDSALMNPVKSVSGLIGIGRNVKYASYQCHICDNKNCMYRNRKTKV